MSAVLLTFDKRQQLIHLRHELPVAAQNLASRIDADLRAIDQPMSLSQAINHMRRELVPLECHDIDAPRPGRSPLAEHERRHVVQHPAQPADKAVSCRSS